MNGIMCKIDKAFQKRGACGLYEWCTGPAEPDKAVTGELCTTGQPLQQIYCIDVSIYIITDI